MKTLWRSLAAVTTAIACLAVMTTPAAAIGSSLVDGNITFTKSGVPVGTLDLGPPTASCTDSLTFGITGASITVTALNWSHNDGTYLQVITRSNTGNSAGTITASPPLHLVSSLRFGMVMKFYETSSCTPTLFPVCVLTVVFQVLGTLTSLTGSGTYAFNGSSTTTVGSLPCTGPLAAFVGATSAATSPIVGHLV